MTPAAKTNLDALVQKTLAVQPRADPGAVEDVDSGRLDQPCPDAAQYIFAAALLQNDIGDAAIMQQLTQQQARGAGADDRDLRAHCSVTGGLAGGMAAFGDQHRALENITTVLCRLKPPITIIMIALWAAH